VTFAQPFKDYEILERIGSGAMGTVFKARQKRLDRIVALKVLKPTLARNTKFVDRLRREARIVASLNHPDIVAGYDLGEEGGYHYFVMEFVEGKSLATLLKEWGMFPEEQVLDVATRVASALDHAFKKGVIHRDIKPGNILIDQQGRAKLTDLGLAKAPEDVTITQEGATVGTPQYISPEQARDPSRVDVRSDLYSLGATLFHMCTGQPPFPGSTLANVIHDVVHNRAPSVTALNPALSDGLSLVIRKLMAKDPALRYQTPAELLADLQRVRRAERPDVDVEALAAEEAATGRRRLPMRPVVAALALLLLLVVAVFAWPSRPASLAGSDPTRAFMQQVRSEVAAAAGWRGKLRALMRAAGEATTDEERRRVGDLRSQTLAVWQEALVAFVRQARPRAAELVLRPEHWRDPAAALRRDTVLALEQKFDISRSELPAALTAALDAELTALEAEVAARVVDRDQSLLVAYRGHLEGEVAAAWRRALDAGDFVAAERELREGSAGFFGGEGRPRRDQLPNPTRAEVARTEERVFAEVLAQIDRAEAAAAESLWRAADDALADLRAQLRDAFDPYALRRRFEAWRAELAVRHPPGPSFRAGKDPWPRVNEAELAFRSLLATSIAAADRRRVQANVQLAVGALLADGDATQELLWLRERDIDDEAVRALRDRWAQVIEEAHAARDWLLGALETRLAGRAVPVGDATLPGRTLQVGVRRDSGQLELFERDGARTRRLSMGALRVSELIDLAPPQKDGGALDRGLALWLYGAGENSVAARRLPPADSAFFGEHVVHVVQAIQHRQGAEAGARTALAHLLQTFRGMPIADLRTALEGFDRSFGQTAVALASEQVLNDVRAHLRSWEQRQDVLTALRGSVTAGLEVEVEAEGHARVTCDPGTATTLALGTGWQRRSERFDFEPENVRLDAVRQHALLLGDGLSTEHGVTFTATLVFPDQGPKPRLYLFEVHGVGVALGLTASGEAFAVVLPADDLLRERALHRDLERELDALLEPRAGVPVVLAGARHQLRVVVAVQSTRLSGRVALDGVEFASGSFARPPRPQARVLLMPMQPLSMWRAVVEGQP